MSRACRRPARPVMPWTSTPLSLSRSSSDGSRRLSGCAAAAASGAARQDCAEGASKSRRGPTGTISESMATAWSISSATESAGSPSRRSMSAPRAAPFPAKRTTTGRCGGASPRASVRARATSAQERMPPNMLTRQAATRASAKSSSKAARRRTASAVPPKSRKLAAPSPAASRASMVAMARPAPLASSPTRPGRLRKDSP